MKKLILVRHGQSIWNLENKFTGWTDVELSNNGILEAIEAGKILKENGFKFDIAYTSVLKRANDTLSLILKELGSVNTNIIYSYKLNERHYGALQGLNKLETTDKYGAEQVKLWRRSVDVRPPALSKDDLRHPLNDEKYFGIDKNYLPDSENLNDTIKRVCEYWEDEIKNELLNDKNVIIVAHGNSLRALMKYIDNISDDEIINIELETGNPICYELNDDLSPICHYYLKEKKVD